MSESATIEAAQQAGSTPVEPEVSPVSAPETSTSPAETVQADSAQASTEKVDKEAEAFARLEAGEDPKHIRQTLGAGEPSKEADKEGGAPQAQQPARAADGKFVSPAEKPAEAQPADAENFADLSANEVQALRRTQLLPSPEIWKQTPLAVRSNLLAQAKRIASQQGRISQQLGQARQTQKTPTEGEAGAASASPQTSQDPLAGQYQQRPQEAPSAVRAQQQQMAPAAAQPAAVPIDPLKGFTEYFGEEVAAPIKQVFGNLQQENQRLQQALQARDAAHSAEAQWLARQTFLPQEREALKELQSEVPTAGKAPEELNKLRLQAGVYFTASEQAGTPITWHDAMLWAGQAMYQPDAKQAAQQALLTNSKRSLKSSPSKPTLKGPARTMSKTDWDAEAFALLSAGRSAKEVKMLRQE